LQNSHNEVSVWKFYLQWKYGQQTTVVPLCRGDWRGPSLWLEDNVSRSRRTIHMRIISTYSWSIYLPCRTLKWVPKTIFNSIRTAKNHYFYHLPFARIFWLVEEIENWKMMRTNKTRRLLCQASHCGSEWSLGRYAIHRNHGLVACAGIQKQHLSGRWLTTSARIDRPRSDF
jgi:hypothetical protein